MANPAPLSRIAMACCLVLSGCAAIGPDIQRPTAQGLVPTRFARQPPYAGPALSLRGTGDIGDAAFWEQFGDAQREPLAAQDAKEPSQTPAVRASMGLYQALAGGWEPAAPVASVSNFAGVASQLSQQ